MPAGGLAFVLGLGAGDAWAQSCHFTPPKTVTLAGSGTSCEFLPRPPVLLEPRLAAECIMDEDGNGLDDEMEAQLARCFVPEFRFDSAENALAACEPVMGFSAYRIQSNFDDSVLIRFRYVALFRHDGGFAADGTTGCVDDHEGDAQGFSIDVRVMRGGPLSSSAGVWRASLAQFSKCQHPELAGGRPVLYPSAGKHHWYCSSGVSSFETDCVIQTCSCTDPHRGNGAVRVPTSLFRTPTSYLTHSISDFNVTYANVCHFGRTGQLVPAPRLQTSRLDNLGFTGQSLHQYFYEGGVAFPGMVLAPDGAFTVDADGDGLPEMWDLDQGVVVASPTDPCTLDSSNPPDLDGDKLVGNCDPDPIFQQKYVGIGEPGYLPAPPPAPKWGPAVSRWGGFWDSDQDGSPNGIDGCPSVSGGGAVMSNRWAEDVNWPPDPATNNELGYFQRGGTCDPYPVSFSSWKQTIWRLNHEYALWSLVELDQAPAFATQRPSSFFPDPEYDPQDRGLELFNVQSAQSLRLRSLLEEQPKKNATSKHDVLTVGLTCAVLTLEQLLTQVKLWFGPDPVSPERSGFPSLRAVAHDRDLTRAVVLRPAEGNYAALELGDALLSSWAASGPVALAPITGATTRTTSAFLPPDGRPLHVEPELLVLERLAADGAPRWARLVPISSQDVSVRYELVAEGHARGPLSESTELVASVTSSGAAAVDLQTGFVEALIYGDDPPARHELPPDLVGRAEAALALHGHNLLVASGAQGSTLASDLWLVDLHTGRAARLREDLPPRRGARLSVTPSGSHVHLAGGRDASGARRDDVWQLSDFRALPGESAPRRLYADTSDRDTFEPRTSPLVYDPLSGDLLQVRFDTAHVQGAALRQRTSFGWEPLGEDGMPTACAPEDPGGNLCPLTTAWWASPGRLPCAGGNCSGTAGAIERTDTLGPVTLRADADQDGVWLLKAAWLERWQRASDGPLVRTASLPLPKLARDVAARHGRAVVATIDGVHLARDTAGEATLSPRLKLCGSPYRVAAVGDDIWAVATTLGLALVGEVEGGLRVESMSLLLPHGLTPLPAGPAGELACTLASSLHAVGGLLGPTSAFADAGGGRLLFASAHHLLDIDVARPTTPTLSGMIDLSHALSNLRVDTSQQRAYGAGLLPSYNPAFDLRGSTAALAGSHEVASWVKRRDAGAFRVRQVALRTEVAQVVP